MPTEEIVTDFNDLRTELLWLSELRAATGAAELELQTLRHRFRALNPEGALVCTTHFHLQTIAYYSFLFWFLT